MKRLEIICGECRNLFSAKRVWQKFCSDKCRNDNGNRLRKEALETVRATAAKAPA